LNYPGGAGWELRAELMRGAPPQAGIGGAAGTSVASFPKVLGGGDEVEFRERALDHALCRQHLGLTDRRRRFDIDNDRVVGIDQVVGRIGKERWPAVRRGPARRWIGRCDELGRGRPMAL
jgi:hypothetical protein